MRNLISCLLAAVAALAFPGCKKDKDIRVGVNVPLSGDLGSYGKNVLKGVELRVQQINDAGGIGGRKIRLLVQDNKGRSDDARSAFNKLADIDNVVAVIGPITSSNALAMKMDAQKSQVPMITPTATNDHVTDNTTYVVRACFLDSFQGPELARYALRRGLRKVAIMTDNSSDYSKGLSKSFRETFEAGIKDKDGTVLRGAVVAQEGYQQNDVKFSTQLMKIMAAGAETIFVPGYPPEVPAIIKEAKVMGFAPRLFGAEGWDDKSAVLDKAGDNIEGCFMMAAFYAGGDRPIVKDFVRQMKARHNETPGSFEALGYDAMLLLAEALKSGTSREEIRASLRQLANVEAVTGSISITPKGDALKAGYLCEVVKEGAGYGKKLLEPIQPANARP